MKISDRNLTLLCDFYELTMARGYFHSDIKDKIAYFDVFFRRVPDGGGYAIFAGLEQIIEYIKSIKFEKSDIEYLRSRGIFDEEFLAYLESFKFTGDIYSVPEGTVIFPNEPIMVIKAPAIVSILATSIFLSSLISFSISPWYPLLIPTTSTLFESQVSTIALIQAFIPWQSPPLQSTAILFIIISFSFFSIVI